MPTYEYRCTDGHRFERFQRMSEPPLEVCPECGAAAERLVSSGAGLLFKGSGFYITDYRSDSYKKSAAAESGSPGEAGPDARKDGAKESQKKADAGSSETGTKGSGPASSSPGKGSSD